MTSPTELDAVVDLFPEVTPWLLRIERCATEAELLAVVVAAINDESLGRIGGLFYNGWAASSIGAAASKRMGEFAGKGGAA